MRKIIEPSAFARIDRANVPTTGDWIRSAVPQPGLERIEAYFSGYAYDLHRHDTYAIGYTMTGVQTFDYRGARLDSTPGKVIVLHPDEVHNGRAGAEGGFRYRMLYIQPRLIADALAGRAAALPFVRTAVVRAAPGLIAALGPALDDLERPLEELQRDQVVLGLAEALLRAAGGPRKASRLTACSLAVARARAFLDAHCEQVVTSEELEGVAGLDRYTLARHFRSRLGTSPYRYLTMRRLDRVRSRLVAGEPLTEAALDSGFADQSHMTRHFKRAFGISPGRWRTMQVARVRGARPPLRTSAVFTRG